MNITGDGKKKTEDLLIYKSNQFVLLLEYKNKRRESELIECIHQHACVYVIDCISIIS